MSFSGEDTLTRMFMPVAEAVMPRAELRRRKRIDAAIDQSGFVEPDAVQILGSLQVTCTLDATAYNSTSTSVWTTCVETVMTLGAGTWTLIVTAMSRGTHSAGTSIDYEINIDGTAYNEVTRTAPTSGGAPFFTTATVTAMPGGNDVSILAEFKCDAGSTATISDSVLQVIALRTA
jgi:hypothetical protein